jgi:hypothetical protein
MLDSANAVKTGVLFGIYKPVPIIVAAFHVKAKVHASPVRVEQGPDDRR